MTTFIHPLETYPLGWVLTPPSSDWSWFSLPTTTSEKLSKDKLISHKFQTNQRLSRWDWSFAQFKNFEVHVQNYRQVSRQLGRSGIDANQSSTEFIQLQWPRQKRFFQHDNKTFLRSAKISFTTDLFKTYYATFKV